MKTIHRYELKITDRPKVAMPLGAEVLSAPPDPRSHRPIESRIEIWARVDDTQPLETREFLIIGTGNYVPDDCGPFIGTVITHGGTGVWHVFEVAESGR